MLTSLPLVHNPSPDGFHSAGFPLPVENAVEKALFARLRISKLMLQSVLCKTYSAGRLLKSDAL